MLLDHTKVFFYLMIRYLWSFFSLIFWNILKQMSRIILFRGWHSEKGAGSLKLRDLKRQYLILFSPGFSSIPLALIYEIYSFFLGRVYLLYISTSQDNISSIIIFTHAGAWPSWSWDTTENGKVNISGLRLLWWVWVPDLRTNTEWKHS